MKSIISRLIASILLFSIISGCSPENLRLPTSSSSTSSIAILETDKSKVELVVKALSGALLLGSSWDEIADEDTKYDLSLTTFYCIMNPDCPTEMPAADYEAFIQSYFKVSVDFLREMQDYDASKNVYTVSYDISVDRAVSQTADYFKIDGIELQDNLIKVTYRTIWGNMAASGDGSDTAFAGYVLLEQNDDVYRICEVKVTEDSSDKYN